MLQQWRIPALGIERCYSNSVSQRLGSSVVVEMAFPEGRGDIRFVIIKQKGTEGPPFYISSKRMGILGNGETSTIGWSYFFV
nr:hypothetical protein [uncultured Acetobacteroides sp.]